jgi:MFS family permease
VVAAILFLFLFLFLSAASAPSPLYGVHAARWHFSPTTLTAVFGVYALALLGALLVTGSLCDTVGRRPVIVAALAVQAVSMVVFLAAGGAGWLYLARVQQGWRPVPSPERSRRRSSTCSRLAGQERERW